MIVQKSTKLLSILCAASLISLMFCCPARAGRGVIALINSKCFVIDTPTGYVLVDGWVNSPKGTKVIGSFNTYGSVKIFDTNSNDVTGYI